MPCLVKQGISIFTVIGVPACTVAPDYSPIGFHFLKISSPKAKNHALRAGIFDENGNSDPKVFLPGDFNDDNRDVIPTAAIQRTLDQLIGNTIHRFVCKHIENVAFIHVAA